MSHIFVSYSRRDLDFAQKIVDALAKNNLDTWIDWKSIRKGEDWRQEIFQGIEEADAFLFLISPDSVASDICSEEIEHAVNNGKRILPVFIANVEGKEVNIVAAKFPDPIANEEINRRHFIFCRGEIDDFSTAIAEIQKTIHTDFDWVRFHTDLLVKAKRWEQKKDASRLLRGKELQEAEQQLAKVGRWEEVQPTSEQRAYVLASRRNEERQRRRLNIGLSIGIGALALISIYAWTQRDNALYSEATAIAEANSRATAESNAIMEANARATALVNEEISRATAQAERNRAEEQARLALSRQLASQAQSMRANNILDTALLLSVEAVRVSPTFEARNNLLEMLLHAPRLRSILQTNGSQTMALSPTGDLLAAVYRDTPARIRFWDVSRLQSVLYLGEVPVPENHQPIRLTFSPDGLRLVAVTSYPASAIAVWDLSEVKSPRLVNAVELEGSIVDILFQSNGFPVAIIDDQAGKWSYLVLGDTQAPGSAISIDGVEFDRLFSRQFPPGTISAKNTGSQIELWDVSTPSQPQLLSTVMPGAYENIDGYAVSADQEMLVFNDHSEVIWLWDISDPTAPVMFGEPFSGHGQEEPLGSGETGGGGETVSFSPDGELLAASRCTRQEGGVVPVCQESVVDLWEVMSSNRHYRYGDPLTGHNGSITLVRFFPNGTGLATGAEGGGIMLWDISDRFGPLPSLAVLEWNQDPAGNVAASRTHNHFVSEITEGQLTLSEITEAGELRWLMDIAVRDFEPIHTVALSADGSTLVVAAKKGRLAAWDVNDPTKPSFKGAIASEPIEWPFDLAVSADGRLLAYATGEQVNLWTIEAPPAASQTLIPMDWEGNRIETIALDANGKSLAVATADGMIQLWDVSSTGAPQLTGESDLGDPDVNLLVFSADSQLLVTAGDMLSYIRILDISNPNNIRRVGGDILASVPGLEHYGVGSLALNGADNLLAAGICASEGGAGECGSVVRFWDLAQPDAPRAFSRYLPDLWESPGELAFTPDGRYLVSMGWGNEYLIWDISAESWVDHACQIAGRNFTQGEWALYFPDETYRTTCPQWPVGE